MELAHRLGVSKQSVSNWENNNIQPSVDLLERLADTFCVSTDALLGRTAVLSLNVEGLSEAEIAHLSLLVQDLRSRRGPA